MANTISPNMSLIVPGVGTEVGPDWAIDLNSDLSILDQHNHSAGQGVQIQPNGLNINSDLPFNSNNATLLRSSRYAPRSIVLSLSTDIGCVYVVGNELYYNDVTGGNKIQLTNNGNVNAGAGSITGLPSGTASASFSAGTFTWQRATATAANMDAASYVFRNSTASSNGLTLQPPNAMAADYSLTLPALPVSQSFMTIDAVGNMSGYASISQGITRTNLASVGQQISASCGTFSTAAPIGAPANITNLSVTITTSGRPVMVMCQCDSTVSAVGFFNNGAGSSQFFLNRTGAANFLSTASVSGSSATNVLPPSALTYLDVPSAGTYTYTVSAGQFGSTSANATGLVLVAYEL